jgi:hypothetical protein
MRPRKDISDPTNETLLEAFLIRGHIISGLSKRLYETQQARDGYRKRLQELRKRRVSPETPDIHKRSHAFGRGGTVA